MSPALRWPLVFALAAVTCQRPVAEPRTPTDDAVTPAPPKAGDRADPARPAADPTHPLELVPGRARFVLMARSPQRLAQVWERDRIVGEHRARYERVVEEMKRDLGRDLLDPADLAAMGIDPSAPVGVAMVSFEQEVGVLFGGLSDPQRLLDEVARLATSKERTPPSTEVVGDARIVRLDEELSLVLRHGMFAVVVVDRPRKVTLDPALEIARIDPAQSVAHAHAMQQAHAGLPLDADVRGMLDVAGIIHDALERTRMHAQESVADSSRRLAEARQRGASAEEIESLQRDLQDQQQFEARRRREQQIAEVLLSRTFGAIEGIGLAVDADAHGLRGRIHLALAPDAAFRELLVPSERPPAAIAALSDSPQLVLSAQLDMGVAIDLFAQAALAAGGSYADVNDEARNELRLDFDRELRPRLDGRATFVLTSGPAPDPKQPEALQRALGGILALGVDDEARTRALLDELAGRWAVDQAGRSAKLEPAPEIGGYVLRRTEWPQSLWIGVVAGQLAMSTDLAALRRLRDGQAGAAATLVRDPEAWQRLAEGPGAGRLAMHHRLPMAAMFALVAGFDSFDFPHNVDHQLEGEFPGEDVFSIPRSAATLRLEKQRDAAAEARSRLRRRRDEERQVIAWNLAEALGLTAGVVRETDTGIVIEGGHYVEGGVGGYVDAIIDLVELEDRARTSVDAQLAKADQRREKAEERLLEGRRKEIRRALAKRKDAPAP